MSLVDDEPWSRQHMSAQLQDLTTSPHTAPSFYSTATGTTAAATMPKRRRTTTRKRKGTMKRSKAVIRKGRVHVKLSRNRTVALAPSQLIKYMPLNKMKRAAQSIIRQSSVKPKRRRTNRRRTTR